MTYYSQRGYSDPGQYFVQKQQQRSQMLPQLLQMMMMFREMKEKKGERAWERGMAEKKFGLSEQTLASQDEYRKAQIAEWGEPQPSFEEKERIKAKHRQPTQPRKTPEDVYKETVAKLKAEEEYGMPKELKETPQYRRDKTLIKTAVLKLNNEQRRLESRINNFMTESDDKAKYEQQLVNLTEALNVLYDAENAIAGGSQLRKRMGTAIKAINRNLSGVLSGRTIGTLRKKWGNEMALEQLKQHPPIPLQPQHGVSEGTIVRNPTTGERKKLINGKWVTIK